MSVLVGVWGLRQIRTTAPPPKCNKCDAKQLSNLAAIEDQRTKQPEYI